MEKVIYYETSKNTPELAPSYVKGRVVVTTSQEAVRSLYEAGATHVFFGKNAEIHLKDFLKSRNTEGFFDLYPTSDQLFHRSIKKVLEVFSPEVPILLRGESGVGKTHLAQKIHEFLHPNQPFISKNLCELSPQLIESELFGHIKGAFTGAHQDKEGLLSFANGGTLFLDEIGAIPLDVQRKLLKVLDEGRYTPVGSNKVRSISFNLITATCEDLTKLLDEGKFREDFYFRICGESLTIPPLRERPEDIRFLLKDFQKGYSRQLFFSSEVLNQFLSMEWKGNTRELFYFYKKLQRGEESYIKELREGFSSPKKTHFELPEDGLPGLIAQIEDQFFTEAMNKHQNRPNRVCKELNISKSVFYRLQEKLISAREFPHHHFAN
jgi:transcriptional regulator with PAS, ATPase and Fis domain